MTLGRRAGIITQARTTSTRLPNKVLLPAGGRSMLDHHLDRLEVTGIPVHVATTVNAADDPILDIAARRGLPVWRGSEHDVLSRFAGCVREHDLDTVVRVTSDCPLIDGQVVADAVAEFVRGDDPWVYLSNGIRRTFPRGMDFEVFSAEALLEAEAVAGSPAQREHVTPWLYADNPRITVQHWTRPVDASQYRLTLDTAEDLTLIRALIEEHGAASLSVDELVALLDRHPELVALNRDVEQKKLGQ